MFGKYLLFDHIGRGGMADIYLASMETSLGAKRRVVVKQILPWLGNEGAFRDMLTAEAKLAAQLRHANVVQVFDLGREDDCLFIAMEYVEGFDLNQLLSRLTKARVPLPAEFALFVVRNVLTALGYAHRARGDSGRPLGIVHRDVSPSNVLISFEGEVKLCDFGIARALHHGLPEDVSDDDLSQVRLAGKAGYMAPEQAQGEEIDARADLFAAGIILWELCAGRRLYRGSGDEMLALAKGGDVAPLPDRGLPDEPRLQAILDRALAKDPGDRYGSAEAMLAELDEYVLANQLMASELRFGEFLTEHFGADVIEIRHERERAAPAVLRALSEGPPASLIPIEEELEENDGVEPALAELASVQVDVSRQDERRGGTLRYLLMLIVSAGTAFGIAYAVMHFLG